MNISKILLLAIPVYFMQGSFFEPGGSLAKIINIIWILFIFVYTIKYLKIERNDRIGNTIILFWLVLSINWLLSPKIVIGHNYDSFHTFGEYKNLTFALMTYFPFAYLIRIGVYRSREMLFFAFLSFISCLICFWVKQSLAMETMFWTENVTNNAGYMLATVLPLLGILMGLGKRKYFYIALVVSVILVSFSVKRGAIVCLIIILFCFWYSFFYMSKSENRQLAFRNLLGALIVLGLLVLGVYYVASTNKYLLLRMQDMLEGNSSGRDVLAESLIKAYDNFLIEEQLFGKGLLQSIHISGNYAHSDWLELLIDGGILGLFVYILLFKNIMFYYIENRIVMSSACKFIVLSVLLSWFAKSIFSMGFFVPESCLYLVAISCTSYLSELNKE